jgi:WD40 repeat-containing protein SMU1
MSSNSVLDIDSNDVIRLVLQFLKENNLQTAMQQLQKDSGVTLNTVQSVDSFLNDIRQGRWDLVLSQVSTLTLPLHKLVGSWSNVENRFQLTFSLSDSFIRTNYL